MPPFTFEPSMTNNIFVPDQLIAGSHPIVTQDVTLAQGLNLLRGTLLGQQTANLYTVVTAPATTAGGANTGNGTIGTTSTGANAFLGTYRVNMTAATTFNVLDPSGETVGTGSTGVAFNSSQIAFTVTAGGTAFVANDGFNFIVEETPGSGAGTYVAATATATDGSQNPKNWVILAEDTNTSSSGTNAATNCPTYIAGEFDGSQMTFGTGLTAAGVRNALRQQGSSLFIKTGALGNNIV